jgi:hypothetical protein
MAVDMGNEMYRDTYVDSVSVGSHEPSNAVNKDVEVRAPATMK